MKIKIPEKGLVGCFDSSDEFVTSLSSSSRKFRQYQKETDFIDRIVLGDPELGKQGLYAGEVRREDIVDAMVEAGLVKNPDSYWGKFQVQRNLSKVHQTNYWKGYSFVQLTEGNFDFTLYKVRVDDVSGLPPF
ncbi:hypothetical protein HOC13_01670 [Candidatus Woesearchaeota archaeon]|jgi:hypothetical protein|nr:hypothetical protein [Candidatus Woesearchaeota archaeon]